MSADKNKIPADAVLLIPEPENEATPSPFKIKPGYYNPKQLLCLIEEHKNDGDATQFIADMLETGDPANDGFAQILRANRSKPKALARIVEDASK